MGDAGMPCRVVCDVCEWWMTGIPRVVVVICVEVWGGGERGKRGKVERGGRRDDAGCGMSPSRPRRVASRVACRSRCGSVSSDAVWWTAAQVSDGMIIYIYPP